MLIFKFIKEIFPLVDGELDKWRSEADKIPCPELRKQALASIRHKKFHCQGGSIYALYPGVCIKNILRFIVAFQTISDYLDNLCDRAGCEDGNAFRLLHEAYLDAVDPSKKVEIMDGKNKTPDNDESLVNRHYYDLYPCKEDGGYLHKLVNECRSALLEMPHYELVRGEVLKLAQLYCDLQTYKHIALDKREQVMLEWAENCNCSKFGISPWEFAAAAGSTLGIFMFCAAVSLPVPPDPKFINDIRNSYFPWICGFHILLDYFIDQEEDRENGDLNFVFYYTSRMEEKERMMFFTAKALEAARLLPHSSFHELVVKGLSAMYLSDLKASRVRSKSEGIFAEKETNNYSIFAISRSILHICGLDAIFMHKLCRFLRKKNLLS